MTDVAVVGGGVTGVSVALALQERGLKVVVLERSGIASGQSGVQPGGVRQQWGTTTACRLARESAVWWSEAEERLASPVPLGFTACGYLFVAHSEEGLARLAANVAVQNGEGVASRIVPPAEAAELVPGSRGRGTDRGGLVCRGRLLRPAAGGRRGDRPPCRRANRHGRHARPFGRRLGARRLVRPHHSRRGRRRDRRRRQPPPGPARLRVADRAGGAAPIPERAGTRAAAGAARRRVGASLRREAASHRSRARQRPGAIGDPEAGAKRWRAAVREGIRRLVPCSSTSTSPSSRAAPTT